MKVEIIKSYGVLAHEGYPVYTWKKPASDIYDRIWVDVPQICGVNHFDEPLVEIDGRVYLLSELLTNSGEKPAILIPGNATYSCCKILQEVPHEAE